MIAYATRPNAIAEDGVGPNSPFTAALVRHLLTPGLDLRIALGYVRDEVLVTTGNRQEPYVPGSLGGGVVSIASRASDVATTAVLSREDARKRADEAANRGFGFIDKGDYDLAIAALNKAIEIEPRHGTAYLARGHSYLMKGDHDHAIADLTESMNLDGGFGLGYVYRGTAYHNKREYNRAVADYTKAIEIFERNPVIVNAIGGLRGIAVDVHYYPARTREAQGHRVEAIKDCRSGTGEGRQSPSEQGRVKAARCPAAVTCLLTLYPDETSTQGSCATDPEPGRDAASWPNWRPAERCVGRRQKPGLHTAA